MEFRIGERDPVTGLYGVIWPDGGVTLNGLKVFNSEHRVGDVVQATERSDGMIILDGLKAETSSLTSATLSERGSFSDRSKRRGYLDGQVFNDEDELGLFFELVPDINRLIGFNEVVTAAKVKISRRPPRPLVVKVGYEFGRSDVTNIVFVNNAAFLVPILELVYAFSPVSSTYSIPILLLANRKVFNPLEFFQPVITDLGAVSVTMKIDKIFETNNDFDYLNVVPTKKYRVRGTPVTVFAQGQSVVYEDQD
jgi:hypothetical protein